MREDIDHTANMEENIEHVLKSFGGPLVGTGQVGVGQVDVSIDYLNDPASEVDIGSENILRASELSSGALRESYEECANRALRLAKANLDRAIEDSKQAERFAHAVRQHGRLMAEKLEAGFARASTIAGAMANGHELIEKN